jgi:hypothetical protein
MPDKLYDSRKIRIFANKDLLSPIISLPPGVDTIPGRWGSLILDHPIGANVRIGVEVGGGLEGAKPCGVYGGFTVTF